MKAKDVLRLLQITRPTLSKYVKEGKLKTNTLPNGMYDYDESTVFSLLNRNSPRKNVIYGRVSTHEKNR